MRKIIALLILTTLAISANAQTTAELYQQRLSKLPTEIEMPYNDVVRDVIDRYTGRMSGSVSTWLADANYYIPIFEQALEAEGMPLELKYLPIIESSLNPRAVSRAGATGLWQFMLATGKQYGLEVNSLVDERMDPIKSSTAAARYLHDLHNIFGDWALSIAAYNCGPENVNKAIARYNATVGPDSERTADYWAIYPYLPEETRGYVPNFIGANYVMNYYCEHGITPASCTLPEPTDTIELARDVHFEQIAAVLNIDVKDIERMNPQYRQNIIVPYRPNDGYDRPATATLTLRTDDIIAFIDNEEEIYNYNADKYLTHRPYANVNTAPRTNTKHGKGTASSGQKSYTVRKGDTLGAIAKRNGTTVAKLKKLNPSIKGTTINAGKKIRVK